MSEAAQEPIGVVGVGWVGLVTAACFASQGHEVWAMDVDEEKVARLSRGELTIHEPGLGNLLRENAERLNFTTSMDELLAGARLLFCCVDTPPTYSGDADLSRVRAVVAQLSGDSQHALVMKSTVPSGTGASIRRDLPDLSYVSCPEFLKEGSAVQDFLNPDRVVIGSDPGDEWAADAVAAAYEPLGGELVRTDVASAEMIKLASNAFLATKISFINEIANVCEEVGADVTEVARGMGLDERIGRSFLNAGIGYGGSCLIGEETVLVRFGRQIGLRRLDDLFGAVAIEQDASLDAEVLEPEGLEVLALGEDGGMEFMPVAAITARSYDDELVEVRTKMGRRLSCTVDHPFVVIDPDSREVVATKLAGELTDADWLPLAAGAVDCGESRAVFSVAGGMAAAGLACSDVIVRPSPAGLAAHAGTARNGTYVPLDLDLDEDFWRIVGLYIAEGHVSVDGPHDRHRMAWSFHPRDEEHLVDEVASYWTSRGVKASVVTTPTTRGVRVSSKILARWWLDRLGVGADCYSHRIPDLAWTQPSKSRRALLSGMWAGDGSWSLVNGGPSVVLEYGTASAELADGMLRMLQLEDVIASQRIGRVAKSTVDTHWLRISGAEQVERALFLLDAPSRSAVRASLAKQSKRISSGGYRRAPGEVAAVRVVSHERRPFSGRVYSLEVPGAHTFAATGGLITHNCFPKDVSALKQLAGNSGYHFQLLNSVIEVNELQKRRVIGKLTKHLGSLVGKRVALLGLAFKANTDDMREASSLVLSARLQGEGADVTAYDPVAHAGAAGLLPSVELAESAAAALEGADAAILVTEWPEFAELDWQSLASAMRTPLLVDGRNFLDPGAVRAAGFTYEGIGRGGQVPS